MNKLIHPQKGVLTKSGQKYSPIGNRVVDMYADEQGNQHELDGSEKPLSDAIGKAEQEKQASSQKKQQEMDTIDQRIMDIDAEIKALEEKEQEDEKLEERHVDMLSGMKELSDKVVEAIKEIPETHIPEVKIPDHFEEEKKWKDEIVKAITESKQDFDISPVVEAVRGITFPQIPQPINYMEALVAIKKALPKEADNTELITAIQNIRFPEFPDFPNLKFSKNGGLIVALEEQHVATPGGSTGAVSVTGVVQTSGEFYIPAFDTQVIDETNSPTTTTITYKKSGVTVATKTISVSGSITTISVTL